jgi:CHRD domain
MFNASNLFRTGLVASAIALAGCSMGPMGNAGVTRLTATLSSAAEVPANASTGSGSLDATLDKGTNMLRWTVTYSGLSGPATMAHFHGPAMPGSNAGVVLPIGNPASPAQGQAALTESQIADLMAGKWYVNVHTAANPGGEIRGQVMVK